jgi:hypothetical protein
MLNIERLHSEASKDSLVDGVDNTGDMVIRLHESIAAVCPIDGVSVGKPGDASTVRIDFRQDATFEQRAAGEAVVKAFDWSDEAQAVWEATRNVPAAAKLLSSADPIPQAVRVICRAIVDEINVRLRSAGIEPVLESQILARVGQYLADGLSLPGSVRVRHPQKSC